MTDVVIEKKGHVAIVKIEHMKAMNALSTDMYAQLEEAFDELAKDLDNVYAVVLTGSSTVNKKGKTVNSFVAGADISEMATKTCEEGKLFGNESNRVCWKIENFKRPVIASASAAAASWLCPATSVLLPRTLPSASRKLVWASPRAAAAPSVWLAS